jgi:hypothetical protein
MKSNIKQSAAFLGVLAAGAMSAQASIFDFYGLGSTWSGTPSFQTVAAPAFTVSEGNFGGAGNNGLAQTFSLATAGTLSSIQIGMSGGPGTTFGMALFDLGIAPPTPSGGASFTVGTDLLSSGSAITSFSLGAFTGSQVANFAFTGADAVTLSANEYYMFALFTGTASTGVSTVQWTRGGATAFTGGQLFRANSGSTGFGALNNAIRDGDFALTVTPTPEPTSLALLGMGALAGVLLRRRNK